MTQLDLQGKTAIVTGSAKGIGFAIAQHLSGAGANVVVSDIDEAGAKSAAAQIPRAVAIASDVRDEEQVKSLVDQAVATFGGLHVMVPNAGIGVVGPIVETDLAAWRAVTSVNLDGVFLCLRYAAPAIIASGGGAIVPVASVTATAGSPLIASYAASKAAVVNLTKTAAVELGQFGVRVNCVLPGFIGTDLVNDRAPEFEAALGLPDGGFADFIAQKQGRYGTVDEVAQAVCFLASDESSFCSGSGLALDGGLTASLF
ncbi:MAG TPA: glucose 1-dehydrogenase [Aeromicrobium sp.]|nr:glucose 1-dehydrogenase [Aeromicrobium sp.]